MHQFLSRFPRSASRVELNGVGALVKETRRDAWHEFSSCFETRREGKTCARLGRLIRYSRRPAIGAMVIINAFNTRIRACVRACMHACKRACSLLWTCVFILEGFIRIHGGHCPLMHCITREIVTESLLGAAFTRRRLLVLSLITRHRYAGCRQSASCRSVYHSDSKREPTLRESLIELENLGSARYTCIFIPQIFQKIVLNHNGIRQI